MKIYDITQPLFECVVFPGDPKPIKEEIARMEDGSLYNLTAISMCAHNGTHVDAPYHFYKDGKGIDLIELYKFIGPCYVETHSGDVTAEVARDMLKKAENISQEAAKRLLIKGKATITFEAAKVFADAGIYLVGNESQTVGPEDAPMEVHLVLLKEEIVLLEGIRLGEVNDGVYLLNCAPLNLTDTDGAPCRAVLIDM